MPEIRPKTVAISQSNYIPWKGYFDLINQADEFVLLDEVQYTRRDWRNRNQIKTPQGLHWVSIPVEVKGKFDVAISEVTVADINWASQHWKTLTHSYGKAPFFIEVREWLEPLYMNMPSRLSEINQRLILAINLYLGITTTLHWSSDFSTPQDKSLRLLTICKALNASTYLSGPAAQDYLDVREFEESGISIQWMDYTGYPEYPQLYPPFTHNVSILDLIFNCGKGSVAYMKSFVKV